MKWITFLKDYAGTGNKAGDYVEVNDSFAACLMSASIACLGEREIARPVEEPPQETDFVPAPIEDEEG